MTTYDVRQELRHFPRDYPMSSRGLSPVRRCIELRQRSMAARRTLPIPPLQDQLVDVWVWKLSRRGQAYAFWHDDVVEIDVCVPHAGFHRDGRMRRYQVVGGHVASIGWTGS